MIIDRLIQQGLRHVRARDYGAAAHHLALAVAAAPGRLDLARFWAEAAHEAGETEAMLARMRERLEARPEDLPALFITACLRALTGPAKQAIDLAEACCLLMPNEAEPAKLLGQLLGPTLWAREAAAALGRAVALAPDDPFIANDYAAALIRAYRYAEGRQVLEGLIARHGADPIRLCNLANTKLAMGDHAGAGQALRDAVTLEPGNAKILRCLLNLLAYTPDITAAAMRAAAETLAQALPSCRQDGFDLAPDPARPLRVGLLSGTMKVHPVGWLTLAGLAALDRTEFSLIALAQNTGTDWIARGFKTLCAEWHAVDQLDDAALADFARAQRLDIVIDLGGYGDHGRLLACAHRLAPVQIKWVGAQFHSTGMPTIDWFLADRREIPPALESSYTERVLPMPDGYVCYLPPPDAPAVGSLPAAANGFITFGCLNNMAKINGRVLAAWSAILRALPHARLLLRAPQFGEPATTEVLRARLAAHDLPLDRVTVRGGAPHRAYIETYHRIDIALDPFPYTGGLTTIEALYMGVPVLTLPGETFAARHSYSHLVSVGLEADWVASDEADYIARAVRLASDWEGLATLRAGLRGRVTASPLADAPRFGKALGEALRLAWQDWCARQDLNPQPSRYERPALTN